MRHHPVDATRRFAESDDRGHDHEKHRDHGRDHHRHDHDHRHGNSHHGSGGHGTPGSTIHGTEATDVLIGTDGNDLLEAGAGNDTLIGGPGDDCLDGGAGIDMASYRTSTSGITLDLSNTDAQDTGGAGMDTLVSIENVTGGMGNDWIVGDAGNNILHGFTGNDVLIGGNGNDHLDGGAGNDQMVGGFGTDTVTYASAAGGIHLVMYLRGWQDTGGSGVDRMAQIENVVGSRFDDSIVASDVDNVLSGGGGNDGLYGMGGNDTLDGGAGDDVLDGGFAMDTASYASITTSVHVDMRIQGFQDTGGGGIDWLRDIEFLTGGQADDELIGDADTNVIDGGLGDDLILGGGGIDYLIGGAGDDVLVGGADRDRMAGRDGADVFRLDRLDESAPSATRDVIADFARDEGDMIDLSRLDANDSVADDQAFTLIGTNDFDGQAGQLRYAQSGAMTIIEGDVNGDGAADFQIELVGDYTMQDRDFLL